MTSELILASKRPSEGPLALSRESGARSGPTLASNRISSVDAYRGFVMFLMMAEVLALSQVAKAIPSESLTKSAWRFLAFHQTHADWTGCSLHDLIQPSFSFLVGVALPFSLAGRIARGQHKGWMIAHAAWRALILVALGVFLRSVGKPQTYFTFEDTLSQIGLGYVPLFLLGFTRQRWQWLALALILVGYWAAFALYALPPGFDYTAAGVDRAWPFPLDSFAAHWNKNTNLAWAFDRWFLNLFPPDNWFQYNQGGYATLSFIPTLGTMILGLIAGGWLKGAESGWDKVGRLALTGAACLTAGLAFHYLGVCPIVKRIWTPAWVLFSGGWCFLLLAGFYAVMDVKKFQTWAFPLRVIGMNSIAAYCIAELLREFVKGSLHTHMGTAAFRLWGWGDAYEPLTTGAAVLAVYWLILFWMYRRGIFLRI